VLRDNKSISLKSLRYFQHVFQCSVRSNGDVRSVQCFSSVRHGKPSWLLLSTLQVTVLVATPGRLLDHLENTSAFRTGEGASFFFLVSVFSLC
jgi:superfamily II DNA/RNA helicase